MSADRSRLRTIGWYTAATLGLLLFTLAMLPGVAEALSLGWLVAMLGNDYFVLATVAALAVLATLVMAARRALGSVAQAEPPDPETRLDAPRPGMLFDQFLAAWSTPGSATAGEDRVREQLRTNVQTAMMRVEGLSRDAAADRIIEGQWTDDPVAARFLRMEPGASPSLRDRLRLALRGERWTQFGARRTAEALVEQYGDTTSGAQQ